RFRGPNGTGVSADKDVPVTWTDKENVLWKTRLPGLGNGSPIVSAGKVFLQAASADGGERLLLCLETASGKALWTKKVPGNRGRTHQRNSLASSTCAADGERVYAVLWDGKDVTLFGYDFDGKELWKYPM